MSRHIRKRGGSLYVWLRDPGWRSGWVILQSSTDAPSGGSAVEFEQVQLDGLAVHLDRTLPRVERLDLRLWPIVRRIWVRGLPRGGEFGGGAGGGGDGGGC